MKIVSIVAALAGLAVTAILVALFGVHAVFRSFLALGWKGFVAICLIHLGLLAIMGLAWRALVPRAPIRSFMAARVVREAGSEVLPLSPIGGCVLGARVLILAGISASIAAASTIVDLTLEFFAKLAYTAIGLALLVSLRPGSAIAVPLSLGLAVASLAAVGFVVAQHRGINLFDRLTRTLGSGWAERTAAGTAALRDALRATYGRRIGLWSGFSLHLFCWIASAVETWVILRILRNTLPFRTVLVIETLLHAVRTLGFIVPNAVGLQEGAYVLIGTGFGLPPPMALVVSLIKRARDLAIGLPALGVWQYVESGRLWRRHGTADNATLRLGRPVGIKE
ncbi:MAG: flippase-like domain-containing protein [Alphaproteobacteria bacterium]|nr:flippase-like domain-containing protein [Alphaproteobacteria bacterium]